MATSAINYGTSTAITFTSLASLATDANLLAGAESEAVDNGASVKAEDYIVQGFIKVGTSALTANKSIEVWVVGSEDGSAWPDVFDGTDSAETATNRECLFRGARRAAVIAPATTADVVYPIAPFSIASLFGCMPRKFALFVVQDTGVALAASGHSFTQTAIKTDNA